MASSDDEGEVVPSNVSDYEFMCDDESVPFAKLPVDWSRGDTPDGKQLQIYLSGKTDNGLRKIYLQVTAWKFALPKEKPEISVLSAQGNWIQLLKPRTAYYEIIRTVLVTLHAIHFAKWNPQHPKKALWDTLKNNLSMFERRPCLDDLTNHMPLIKEAIKWDSKLEKSQLLSALLAEKPWVRKTYNEDVKPPFIVNEKEDPGESEKADDENENSDSREVDNADENEDSDSEESDCYDSVCAICDNGGDLLLCDGKCMRSFHATVEDGEESKCDSLRFTDEDLEAINNVPFICDNCKYKKHQCFACGKLGSSDELSNPEVFCCVNGACGYFYHPHCVATILHRGDNAAAEELEKKIVNGEPFACPIHKCNVCNELEDRAVDEMQFAVCRRCPKAYHRKCKPREITSQNDADSENIQRAWEGLIPKRILIYCLDHEIEKEMMTPHRGHIVFPGPRQEKKKIISKNLSKEKGSALEDNAGNRISRKQQKESGSKGVGLTRKRFEELPTTSSKKQKLAATRKSHEKLKQSSNAEAGVSSDEGSYATFSGSDFKPVNPRSVATRHADSQISKKVKPTAMRTNDTFTLDADVKRRILTLMKDASKSVTIEEVRKRYKPPSTHAQHSRFLVENVTLGRVEGSIQAVRTALKKLEEGSVGDAQAVCNNDLLQQVFKWREKLRVYLAPFLYGARYTSFGRHFTKMDKLKEITDLLHWYVEDGDMLVDFCCGSNDFSCIMKNKLDEMKKKCSFKNYDILQAKNDFNFERRDWMGVKKHELPDGSKLIMGLNPPFGVNASLANTFINKALEFKPKLIILIVPRETQRLDKKKPPYDLIWEDDQMLAGKSFYLPGSVDVNDKQIDDWNLNAPVLYLWSSGDWTHKHRAIAEKHGHESGALRNYGLNESPYELHNPNPAQAVSDKDNVRVKDKPADTAKILQQKETEIISHQERKEKEIASHREGLPSSINNTPRNLEQKASSSHLDDLPLDINNTGAGKGNAVVKNHSEPSSKSYGGEGNKNRTPSNMFHMDQSSSKYSASRHQSPYMTDHMVTHPAEHHEAPFHFPSERGDYRQPERGAYQPLNQNREASQVHHISQSNFSTHQPYSRIENDDDEVRDLLNKYGDQWGSMGGVQTYDQRQAYSGRFNYDYASPAPISELINEGYHQSRIQHPQRGMGGGQAYHGTFNQDYTSTSASNLHSPMHFPGRMEPNSWDQGTALPPYQGSGSSHRYGLGNIVPTTSSYGGLSAPTSQRYASRLDEPFPSRMGPTFTPEPHPPLRHPNQAGLGFAQGPYDPPPHHSSSGWIND